MAGLGIAYTCKFIPWRDKEAVILSHKDLADEHWHG